MTEERKIKFLLEKKGWKTLKEEKENPTVITKEDLESYRVTPREGGNKLVP